MAKENNKEEMALELVKVLFTKLLPGLEGDTSGESARKEVLESYRYFLQELEDGE